MATDQEANIDTDPKKDKTVNDNSPNIEAKQHNDGERRQGGKKNDERKAKTFTARQKEVKCKGSNPNAM